MHNIYTNPAASTDYFDSGSYSISPSKFTLPVRIVSPFARSRSSTVLSVPSSVLS